MLNLILGRAGYGKTNHVYEKIAELVKSGEKVLLLVPEQFSFESEKRLYFELGASSSFSAEVISFSRLCHHVFHRYGARGGTYLSKGGKKVLVRLSSDDLGDELTIYGKSRKHKGFLDKMAALIDQIKQAGANEAVMGEVSGKLHSDTLKDKFSEIHLLYAGYDAYLKRGFVDSEDDMTACLELIREHDYFDGYHVFIDEFKGFTAVEIEIIEEIIKSAKSVTCALCIDELNDTDEGMGVLSGIKRMANSLVRVSKENNVPVSKPTYLYEPKRFKNEELKKIEKDLFFDGSKDKLKNSGNIEIFEARTRYNEIEYVSATIKKLVREKGYRYKEIMVVGRDIDDYKNSIETIMTRYEIPYFYGVREPFFHKPLPAFIRFIMKAAVQNYENESIFSALKTDMLPVPLEDICMLENYIYVWNIKGKVWESEFKQNPRGFTDTFTEEDLENLAKINLVREEVVRAIAIIRELSAEVSGSQFAMAIYKMMEELSLDERMETLVKDEENDFIKQEYNQTWDMMVSILEEFYTILKHHTLKKAIFVEFLEIMIESADLGEIPQMLDEVLIGDASLVRASDIKAVFIVGCNEEIFPKLPEEHSIFSDDEKKELSDAGLNIADTLDEKMVDEEFIAYKTLTSSSEKLYISYPLYDELGKTLYPSSLINRCLDLFSDLEVVHHFTKSPLYYAENKGSLIYEYARNYHMNDKDHSAMENVLRKYDDTEEFLENIERVSQNLPITITDREIGKKLFGKNIRMSPTGVERFYKCPFSYFAAHGLRIQKPIKADISPMMVGNVVHYVLQVMVSKYGGKGLAKLSEKEIDDEIIAILDEYLAKYLGGLDDKTRRFKYLYTRLKNTLKELIIRLAKEFEQSEFDPLGFEVSVKDSGDVNPIKVELEDGNKAYVEGVIDRVDVMKKGSTNYIRVIDYKTGSRDFKLSNVYYGLDLQMLIYLFSVCENEDSLTDKVPAGIFYMPARVTNIDVDREMDEKKIESEKIKTYRMNGLVVNDREVVAGMEKDGKGIFIPVKFKGDDELTAGRASERLATYEELGSIYEHIKRLLSNMGNALKEGGIEAVPKIDDDKTACEYCQYNSICSHEDSDGYNEILKFNKSEFYKKIGGEDDEMD